MADTFILITVN